MTKKEQPSTSRLISCGSGLRVTMQRILDSCQCLDARLQRPQIAAARKSSEHSEVGSCEVVPTEFTNDSLAICAACAALFMPRLCSSLSLSQWLVHALAVIRLPQPGHQPGFLQGNEKDQRLIVFTRSSNHNWKQPSCRMRPGSPVKAQYLGNGQGMPRVNRQLGCTKT